jgi:N-acetyl-anhydromuramyl-L-alanine amidase AmpD
MNTITIPGLRFDTRPRASKTLFLVVHWTGGSSEGSTDQARRVYNTLVNRDDSIHFVCATDGTLVQMADLDAHCVHAGSRYNDNSVGVEVVCPGTELGLESSVPRPKFASKVHGAPVTYYGFTGPQIKAVSDLAQAVMWRYGLSYAGAPVCVADEKPESFEKGVIGHFQVSSDKADPGPETMYQIRSRMQDQSIFAGGLWMAIGEGVRRFLIAYG